MVFVFGSVYVMDYVYGFEPALHHRDESYLVMMDKVLDALLQSVCRYFIEDFCIDVHHGYWPEVFFSRWVSAGFWYHDDVGLVK